MLSSRQKGLRTAALTNNWYNDAQENSMGLDDMLKQHFDVIVESRVVKMRKPDPKIYQLVVSHMGLEPHQCVYLDDILM